jgi:DHA3 family macrolide efflux protein-like MFS transporter
MFGKNVVQATEPKHPPMRPFFAIWTGQAFSLFGSALVQFALVWWLAENTGSATALAAATMMALLPQVVVGPFAGALVDRWSRRSVLIVADGASAVVVAVLGVLFALNGVHLWHVYVVVFVRAIAGAFHWPAMQATTSLMVSDDHLSRVAGLNQTLQGLAAIVAPPLGALLLDSSSMQAVLAVDVVTAAMAIMPLLAVVVPQPAPPCDAQGAAQSTVLDDVRQGFRFLWGWRGMMLVVGIAMAVNLLLHPALSLQPLLVADHFGGGALELAWFQSAFGLGFVVGGIALSAWGGFKRRAVTGLLALALSGCGFALVGLTPATAFGLAVGAIFLAGFMIVIVNGSVFAMLQAIVPPEVQGRVFTVVASASGIMAPLGLAIAGPVADALGVRAWFAAAGGVMLAIGIGGLFVPSIINIEDRPNVSEAAPTKAVYPAAVNAQ